MTHFDLPITNQLRALNGPENGLKFVLIETRTTSNPNCYARFELIYQHTTMRY